MKGNGLAIPLFFIITCGIPASVEIDSIMKFLDQAKVYLRSGNGGPGSLSFRREKYIEFGGPNGGNGGRGGSVVVECVEGLNTLIDYRYQQHFKAKNGGHGMGQDRTGLSAADVVLKVPVGTQVMEEDNDTLICDMVEVGQTITLCKGGDGGRGNAAFKTSTNRAPRKFEPGWPGEERWIWLRLKLIADAGLVGLPNAGKSTFLSVTSRAKPKIADYPFTTLVPQLGVVGAGDKEFVLADIPGLIEGASEGIGLGHRFLGHVERCRVLLHLIDGTEEDVLGSYKTIRGELEAYADDLAEKDEIIALNKIDALLDEEIDEKVQILEKASGKKVMTISAATGDNVEPLLFALLNIIGTSRRDEQRALEKQARLDSEEEVDDTWQP